MPAGSDKGQASESAPGASRAASERAPGLSRERILEAAADLVEREGMDAVSMRRLAQALDVWPMALYRYFDDKEALLDALVARATDGVARPDPAAPWREQMRELLAAAREALGGEALGAGTRVPRALVTPGVARLAEDGVRILRGAGLDEPEAAAAWRTLLAYTVGFAALGTAPAEDFDWGLERLLDGLEARRGAPTPRRPVRRGP